MAATAAGTDGGPSEGGTAPPAGMAIDHEPTRVALGVHARRPLWFLGGALIALVIAGGLARVGAPDSVWIFPVALAVAGVILAPYFALRWRSLRRILRASPWVARRGRHFVTGYGQYRQATILLEADEHGPELMCSIPEGRAVHTPIADDGPLDVWVAGDPVRGAVVTVDGTVIAPLEQPYWGWWRRHLRARIAKRESGDRPDLYRPTRRS